MGRRSVILVLSCILLAAVGSGVVFVLISPGTYRPLATVSTADGRLFHVEGVTYGTNHIIGSRSVIVDRFGQWLPQKLRARLKPKYPQSEITLESPALVVWVNATDPLTGKHVDCQGVRLEFEDTNGDLFGQETSSWFGDAAFWRVGHAFTAFPRAERQLQLRIIPWRKQQPAAAMIPNPQVVASKIRPGRGLPQVQTTGGLEIHLTALTMSTNGSPERWDQWAVALPPNGLAKAGG